MLKQMNPLSAEILEEFKSAIRFEAERFRTNTIKAHTVLARGGQSSIKHNHYPIKDAFEYFENEGVGKILSKSKNDQPDIFEILDPEYFKIDFEILPLPVTFSIDDRIQSDLVSMVEIYVQVYDCENRLRFFLTEKLKTKYGEEFFKHLPRKVRDNIEEQKKRLSLFIEDPRIKDLEYSYFTDMKRILVDNDDFVLKSETRTHLLNQLDYLADARNYTAHNIRLSPIEIKRVKESCKIVRKTLEN